MFSMSWRPVGGQQTIEAYSEVQLKSTIFVVFAMQHQRRAGDIMVDRTLRHRHSKVTQTAYVQSIA